MPFEIETGKHLFLHTIHIRNTKQIKKRRLFIKKHMYLILIITVYATVIKIFIYKTILVNKDLLLPHMKLGNSISKRPIQRNHSIE